MKNVCWKLSCSCLCLQLHRGILPICSNSHLSPTLKIWAKWKWNNFNLSQLFKESIFKGKCFVRVQANYCTQNLRMYSGFEHDKTDWNWSILPQIVLTLALTNHLSMFINVFKCIYMFNINNLSKCQLAFTISHPNEHTITVIYVSCYQPAIGLIIKYLMENVHIIFGYFQKQLTS